MPTLPCYRKATRESYHPAVINHSVAYADGSVHTHTMEGFWSFLKRLALAWGLGKTNGKRGRGEPCCGLLLRLSSLRNWGGGASKIRWRLIQPSPWDAFSPMNVSILLSGTRVKTGICLGNILKAKLAVAWVK